ncbi:MAG: mechanosensitive ion channel, partial [Candidatus Korarchaeota archaeon]|nr:mechanosensitive ion channel [Candidatus Korarchaeota archaeon]
VSVYIPNQELLKSEIDNYGKRRIIRRSCTITAGYELDFEYVQKALITAASNVEQVLNVPNPYVRITAFKDFAVEYTLYVFVNDIRRLREIDADLRKTVLETCKSHKIDI